MPIMPPAPVLRERMTASLPSSGATEYSLISAIPSRMKTMPNEPCGRGSISLPPLPNSRRAPGNRSRFASWAVEVVSYSESRFEAVRMAGLTDLIGREDDLDFLLERQRLAWKGEGQIVLISGEPGIGKSRLVAALAERITGEPHTRLRYQCSPYHTNSALRPFIAHLERAAGFKADDTSEQRLDKLEVVLAMGAWQVQAVAPLFAALLSIPFGERYPPLALSPTQHRRRA